MPPCLSVKAGYCCVGNNLSLTACKIMGTTKGGVYNAAKEVFKRATLFGPLLIPPDIPNPVYKHF